MTMKPDGVTRDLLLLPRLFRRTGGDVNAERSRLYLRALAQVARLRGAHTVIVGIQPDVAIAMTRLGTTLHAVPTALGLEEGVDLLDSIDVARGVDDGPRRD